MQWTNINILMVVGIYQFDTFNQITGQDFNVTLPASGIAPASSQPPATPVPATPPTEPTGPTQSADPAPPPAQPTQPTQRTDPATTPAPDPAATTPSPSPLTTWWTGGGQSDTQAVQTDLSTVQNDITGYQGGADTVSLATIQADAATLQADATTANGSGVTAPDVPGYGTAMDDFVQAAQALASATDASGVSQASALLTSGASSLQTATAYISANTGS